LYSGAVGLPPRQDIQAIRASPEARASSDVRRVTLVTERYHILRSRLLLTRALAARRLGVEVPISAAPDHLGFFERITRCFKELKKLAWDLWSP
jgi:hypothetical protein